MPAKMDRRTLLRWMLTTPLAASLDVEALLWTPRPMITVPSPMGLVAGETLHIGDVVYFFQDHRVIYRMTSKSIEVITPPPHAVGIATEPCNVYEPVDICIS